MRIETDALGQASIPKEVLYGIHAWRAARNFPDRTPFHLEWYQAMGLVKQAVYQTILALRSAAHTNLKPGQLPHGLEDVRVFELLQQAASEVASGEYFDHFIVPANQGGAGTSINMNVNEILANVTLIKMGLEPGRYDVVHPLEHANLFQSTNDVVPTALKIAVMQLLNKLEYSVNSLRQAMEVLENKHRNDLRLAFTQMQPAVPSSFGMLFGAYNDALSRDWWRVSKCFERIKTVNLGGGATGSGLAIPRFYIMEVVSMLQKLTKLPLSRGENLTDTTQNLDTLVEVHAILKAHAVNLEKISADFRLLSSGLAGKAELTLKPRQAGSSIMPAKVNPVIPEFVIGIAHKVYSNDMLVSSLCGQSCLDLNAYLPFIGHAMLESLQLLIDAGQALESTLREGVEIHRDESLEKLMRNPSIVTALVPLIGYRKAGQLAGHMKQEHADIMSANKELQLIPEDKLKEWLKPENLLRLGYSLKDI